MLASADDDNAQRNPSHGRARGCGLLEVRPVGRQSYYRLAHDVGELLTATRVLLARTGWDVELCPNDR